MGRLSARLKPRPSTIRYKTFCFSAQQNASSVVTLISFKKLQRRIAQRHELNPARARTEDSKLRKDRLEVLAKTHKPFEELCPRIEAPWPRRNFSGFTFWVCLLLTRCRTRYERFNKCPASHTALDGLIVISRGFEERKHRCSLLLFILFIRSNYSHASLENYSLANCWLGTISFELRKCPLRGNLHLPQTHTQR